MTAVSNVVELWPILPRQPRSEEEQYANLFYSFDQCIKRWPYYLHNRIVESETVERVVLGLQATQFGHPPQLMAIPLLNALEPARIVDVGVGQTIRLARVPQVLNLRRPLQHLLLETGVRGKVALELHEVITAEGISRTGPVSVLHGLGGVALVDNYGHTNEVRILSDALGE